MITNTGIMNQEYYQSLVDAYQSVAFTELPPQGQSVPMTAEEYDYKTYWVARANKNFEELEAKALELLLNGG
jgi:hypothetical protein